VLAMICRSDGAYRNFFRGNYKDLAPTEHALALEMSKLQTDPARVQGVPVRTLARAEMIRWFLSLTRLPLPEPSE
jgi:hypothetical protein